MANETKKYTVLKNLRHDGKGFAPGKIVELDDKSAKPLLESKVVEPFTVKEKAAK
jgi:hypothetical protein